MGSESAYYTGKRLPSGYSYDWDEVESILTGIPGFEGWEIVPLGSVGKLYVPLALEGRDSGPGPSASRFGYLTPEYAEKIGLSRDVFEGLRGAATELSRVRERIGLADEFRRYPGPLNLAVWDGENYVLVPKGD